MAGGVGSRLWPISRQSFPKQFHDVLGTGRTLLQETIHRFEDVCPKENIVVVTNKAYAGLVKEQVPFLEDSQILQEPIARNTAPCIAYACFRIAALNPNANIVVSPADHIILNVDNFQRCINTVLKSTEENDILVTLGIKPSRPDTGYGYIQYKDTQNAEGLHKVKTFTEKPNRELAEVFIESGDFVWNAGIFVWNAKTILKAFSEYLFDLFAIFADGNHHFFRDSEEQFVEAAFAESKSISIDYGILEKADNVWVLPADFGWSDLGTWKSLFELSEKDDNGNSVKGNVSVSDTRNSIVRTEEDKLVVVHGLQDVIVAQFDGVTMVCNKEDEQKVRDFVAEAKKQKGKNFV